MDWIYEPWPWFVGGPLIVLVMFLLIYFGKAFGVSSNLRTMCAIGGAGKFADFFKFDWKKQIWNLVFVLGGVGGGVIASQFMMASNAVDISEATKASLTELGIHNPGVEFVPEELFGLEALTSWQGILFLVVGGLLIGFGTRYAGGCTSGHAISGLSNLQLPSLIAVVGFFIGGLAMTHFILPHIL